MSGFVLTLLVQHEATHRQTKISCYLNLLLCPLRPATHPRLIRVDQPLVVGTGADAEVDYAAVTGRHFGLVEQGAVVLAGALHGGDVGRG